MIILANNALEPGWRLIQLSLAFVELQAKPEDYMVNRVLEVSESEGLSTWLLPVVGSD